MGKTRIGVIRVVTLDDEKLVSVHGDILRKYFPYMDPLSYCIPDQPLGVYDEETEMAAAPKVAELAKRLEREGCKVIIISCAGDPGIDLARQQVNVPVIGAGSAAGLLARALGRKVGVIGITAEVPRVMKEVLGEQFAGYCKPDGVQTTLDLQESEAKSAVIRAAENLAGRGAEVIALGCTGMSTAGLAADIHRATGLPVIDPVYAAGLVAAAIVNC